MLSKPQFEDLIINNARDFKLMKYVWECIVCEEEGEVCIWHATTPFFLIYPSICIFFFLHFMSDYACTFLSHLVLIILFQTSSVWRRALVLLFCALPRHYKSSLLSLLRVFVFVPLPFLIVWHLFCPAAVVIIILCLPETHLPSS